MMVPIDTMCHREGHITVMVLLPSRGCGPGASQTSEAVPESREVQGVPAQAARRPWSDADSLVPPAPGRRLGRRSCSQQQVRQGQQSA